jgi:Ca-activated chloride channel family protein
MIQRKPVSQPALRFVVVRHLFFSSIVLVAMACLSSPPRAQTSQQPEDDEVLRVSTDLILFPARIRDRRGERPNGLTTRDLNLKDPDKATTGLYLAAGVDRVALIFALDQSGSLRDIINEQRDAALKLYERFGSRSSVAVLHFAETPHVAAPFSRDAADARSAFELSARPNQHTAIFDAAATAIQMFSTLPRIRSERRIVIVISDGLDNFSKTKSDKVIEAARDANVSFYVIHLPLFEPRDGALVVRSPAKGFRDLAAQTGGKYFLARDAPLAAHDKIDLTSIFQAIEEDLRSQYLIGFYVSNKAHDGKIHKLSLSLSNGLEYQVGDRGFANSHKFVVR